MTPRQSLASLLLLATATSSVGCGTSVVSADKAYPTPTEAIANRDLNERQRELARIRSASWLGWMNAGFAQIGFFTSDVSDMISGAPSRYGQMLAQKENPDDRREAVVELTNRPWGQTETYTKAYAALVEDQGQNVLIRSTSLRSLNRSRATTYVSLYVKQLSDPSELVRLEACKALHHMPDPSAAPDLLKLVGRNEENRDVRIAAAEALRHYKRLDVVRGLVSLLNERDFALAWQARRSAIDITGKDFGYSEAKWLAYLGTPDPANPLG